MMKSTAASQKNLSASRELLTVVYEAFNRRDIESILAVMHPQVKWPNGMEGGWVHGREGVRAYWTRQWGLVNPHVEPAGFEVEENGRILVNVHEVVHDLAGAIILDRTVRHVYELNDGLICDMEIRE